MIGRVLRRPPALDVVRERWTTPDDDFVDVDIVEPATPARATVLILHGLEGSSERSYVRILIGHLLARGLRAAALNFRSCSGEPNRRAQSYHAGHTVDAELAIARLAERWPERPLAAVGFSLGGNVLLKLLAQSGTRTRVDCAAVVSVPFDLAAGARWIGHGVAGRVYTGYFLRSLRRKLQAKRQLLDAKMLAEGLSASNLVAFDDAVTAPLHGFAGATDYYARSSSAPLLGAIRTPTLVLHAADDPFLPQSDLPGSLRAHAHLQVVVTRRGGHMGFLQGASREEPGTESRMRYWAEEAVADYLAQQVGTGTSQDAT